MPNSSVFTQDVHEPMARKAPAEREGFDEENRLGDDERPDRRRRGPERAATEVAERDRLSEGDHVKQAQKQDRRRQDLAHLFRHKGAKLPHPVSSSVSAVDAFFGSRAHARYGNRTCTEGGRDRTLTGASR